MSELIKSSRDGMVVTITIDRPAEGNVLTLEMLRALTARLKDAGASDAKVIALRSTGADFCKGRDSKGGPSNPTALVMRDQILQPILDVYDALNNVPQPVICAVQGAAHGFGCAMATAADITIAADGATFKLPEMTHNLPPTLAISALMTKVPRKAIAWLVYTLAEIDAKTALSLGIVSAVVPKDKLDGAIDDAIKAMTSRSPAALVAVKDYLRSAPMMEPRGAAAYGAALLVGRADVSGALAAETYVPNGTILLSTSCPMSARPSHGIPDRAHQWRAISSSFIPNSGSFGVMALQRPSMMPATCRISALLVM